MLKSPISYYGGKASLISEILPLIPKHRIFTEAFFGSGSVFFSKEPSESEVINDSNHLVVNFFEVCKTDFENLKKKIEATLFSRASYTVALSMYRMPHLFSKLQLAWAFYVATNMGFANNIGSWGYDKYGKRAKTFLNKKLSFDERIVQRLLLAQIENTEALQVIKARDTVDAFHYIDPPYVGTHMGIYGGYTEQDYRNLLDLLSVIQGKFLLSSYPSDILDEYIAKNGWYTKTFDKPLSARKTEGGKPRARKTEVLTANYPI